MNRTTFWTSAAFVAAAAVLAFLPGAQAQGTEGNCNNYGVAVNTYIFSGADCSSHENIQYCHQGTGAGAAAGAGSGTGGGNTGEAEASAGSRCTQNGNNTSGVSGGGPILGELFQMTQNATAPTIHVDVFHVAGTVVEPTYVSGPTEAATFTNGETAIVAVPEEEVLAGEAKDEPLATSDGS